VQETKGKASYMEYEAGRVSTKVGRNPTAKVANLPRVFYPEGGEGQCRPSEGDYNKQTE